MLRAWVKECKQLGARCIAGGVLGHLRVLHHVAGIGNCFSSFAQRRHHLHKGALFSLSCLFLFPLSLSSLNNSCMCVWCSEGTGWAGTVEVEEGSYEYKYILDECMWIHDQHLVTLFATTRSFLHLSIVALGRSRGLLW